MRNLFIIFITSFFLICCNNVSDLETICKNEKLNFAVNEFIKKVNEQKTFENENAIHISGIKKNDSIYEISVHNDRPTIFTDETAKFLNSDFEKSQIGFFKYKGYDFFINGNLKELYIIKYENAMKLKSKYNEEATPYPKDWPTMWINLNIKRNQIRYTIPFAGVDWTDK